MSPPRIRQRLAVALDGQDGDPQLLAQAQFGEGSPTRCLSSDTKGFDFQIGQMSLNLGK